MFMSFHSPTNLGYILMRGRMDNCNLTKSECTVGERSESIIPVILQILAGFIGNLLAIIILIKTASRHKWKPFYRLVLALALTDSTVSVLGQPIVLKRYVSNFIYCFTDYECKHVAFVYSFAFLASALIVTSMSLDRFLAIVFPIKYKNSNKYIRVNLMIATGWTVAIAVCGVSIGMDRIKLYYPESWCFIDFSSKNDGDVANIIVTYIYSIIGVFLFSITTTANTVVIVTMVRRIVANKKNLGTRNRLKADIHIVTFLCIIVVVFSVCWVPLVVVMLININSECPLDGKKELLVARLAISNSIVDPWVYIVLRMENLEFIERIIAHCKTRSYPITRDKAIPNQQNSNSLNNTVEYINTAFNDSHQISADIHPNRQEVYSVS